MTREEYERLKQAEKEHLLALKKLKQTVHQSSRKKKVTDALTSLATSARQVLDTHDEMVEKLDHETALGEARMDIALDAEAAQPTATPLSDATMEADMQKQRAQNLIQQMKRQMGQVDPPANAPAQTPAPEKTLSTATRAVPTPTAAAHSASEAAVNPTAPEDLPEKTLGRMKPRS